MTPPRKINDKVTRRELLGLFGVGAGAAVVAACGGNSASPSATSTPAATSASTAASTAGVTGTPGASALSCIVSSQMTEGPYFVDEKLNRSDIRTDPTDGSTSEGVPLRLAISVQSVNGDTCAPVSGAQVDIWHCDASGLYSDEQANGTAGKKYLRGYQLTDANGHVEFTTIYPGWYMGRAVHVHVKVRTNPSAQQGYEFTSQFFFDDSLSDQVYTNNDAYSSRGERDTENSNDNIFSGGGDQMTLALTPDPSTGSGQDGYAATFNIGLQM
jgi:protocatechuate 3,4-dioxygenase beta subunit